MTFMGDSRSLDKGPGILPLQDFSFKERGVHVANRHSVLAMRVIGYREGTGQLPRPEYEESGIGDLSGFLVLQTNSERARVPAWREIFPVIIPLKRGNSGAPPGGPPAETTPKDPPTGPPAETPSSGGGSGRFLGPVTGDSEGGNAGDAASDPEGVGDGGISGDVANEVVPPEPPKQPEETDDGDDDDNSGDGYNMTPCPPKRSTFEPPDQQTYPIRTTKFDPDERFLPTRPSKPPTGWGALPGGTIGALVQGTEESSQEALILHCDPRIVAPHRGGIPGHATKVCDLSPDGDFNRQRRAGLHTIFRVVQQPFGELSFAGNRANTVALNIGGTGLKDAVGGLVVDACGGKFRVGHLSVRDGGPIDVGGGKKDKHGYASDRERHTIHPAHLSGRAFWREHKKDGPMEFDTTDYIIPSQFDYLAFTYLRYDPAKPYKWPRDSQVKVDAGVWRWETEVPLGDSGDGDTPTGDTGVPNAPETPPNDPVGGPETGGGGGDDVGGGGDGQGPGTGNGGGGGDQGGDVPPPPRDGGSPPETGGGDGRGGGSGPGGDGAGDGPGDGRPGAWGLGGDKPIDQQNRRYGIRMGDNTGTSQPLHTLYTHRELTLPGIVGRPQQITDGNVDLRYTRGIDDRDKRPSANPISFRLEAYGEQNGGGWAYGEDPENSRWPGGTVSGGAVVLPPELNTADGLFDYAPAGITASTTYFVMGPGVALAWGTPDTATGGVTTGYRATHSSGEVVFSRLDGAGTATASVGMTEEGALELYDLSGDPAAPSGASALYSKSGELYHRDPGGNVSQLTPLDVAGGDAFTQTYSTGTTTHAARTATGLTDNSGGSASGTLAAITGGGTNCEDETKNAIASLAAELEALRQDHLNTAQVLNKLLDNLQAKILPA